MPEQLNLKIRGVYSLPNSLSEVPEGALASANNIVIDGESIAESRRGFKQYGNSVAGESTTLRRIIPYQNALIAHTGSTLKRDEGGGIWAAYSGTFEEPGVGARVRDAQVNKNLYLTTAAGVRKLDAIAGTWRAGGTPRPLDGTVTLTGSSGFMPDQVSVAYRAVFLYTDANENEIVSAPSQRVIASNDSGGTRDVTVRWYLPDGLTTAYTIRVYRSAATEALLDEPSDELQQIQEAVLSSTNISNGYIDLDDNTPSSLRGAFLYTSPSQEGIAEENDQPPFALDICEYKGHLLYANVRSRHRLSSLLLGAGDGSLTWVDDNVVTTNGSAVVTSVADTSNLHVGMKVKAAAGIPSTARILSIDSGTQITMTVNATATGARDVEFQDIVTVAGIEYFAASATSLVNHEFEAEIADTPATNIELTALSLVFAINQNPDNSTVYAFYTSGFEDIPGNFEIEERGIGGDAFTMSSTAGDSFSPPMSTARTSSNSTAENTIMSSKFQQPEAVPLKNKFKCGVSPIRRILALRDAAYALGTQIYKLTGDSTGNFATTIVDTTAKLKGPETAVVFNDSIYCMSDQGIIKIGDSGVQVVSRAIEDDLQRITSSENFPNFEDYAFGVAYETARRYCLAVPDETTDTRATKWWIYNAFTSTWTNWSPSATAGLVNPADDRLYFADFTSGKLYQERKGFSRLDYADDEYDVTISDFDGFTVTVDDTSNLAEGYMLKQDYRESVIVSVVDATTLEVEDNITWDLDEAKVYKPISGSLVWAPATAGNPALMKHWQDACFLFKNADFAALDATFSNDFFPLQDTVELEAKDLGGAWGTFPWGEVPWGAPQRGEQIIRTWTPRELRRCHWLNVGIDFQEVFGNFKLSGVALYYEPMSPRFR